MACCSRFSSDPNSSLNEKERIFWSFGRIFLVHVSSSYSKRYRVKVQRTPPARCLSSIIATTGPTRITSDKHTRMAHTHKGRARAAVSFVFVGISLRRSLMMFNNDTKWQGNNYNAFKSPFFSSPHLFVCRFSCSFFGRLILVMIGFCAMKTFNALSSIYYQHRCWIISGYRSASQEKESGGNQMIALECSFLLDTIKVGLISIETHRDSVQNGRQLIYIYQKKAFLYLFLCKYCSRKRNAREVKLHCEDSE